MHEGVPREHVIEISISELDSYAREMAAKVKRSTVKHHADHAARAICWYEATRRNLRRKMTNEERDRIIEEVNKAMKGLGYTFKDLDLRFNDHSDEELAIVKHRVAQIS